MLLVADKLSVEFKNGYKGIDNINFKIGNGIYGLLGENGAGKTTLMRVLTTLIQPTEGDVRFGNLKYEEKNYCSIKKKIGYLPQELELYPNLTVLETLLYLGELSGLERKVCKDRVNFYLEKTGLSEHKNKKNKQLSGGMKRRVGLIQAMLAEPELLIIDEPTTGLDPEERVRIRKLLVEFSKERTVLFSTHVVEDLAATTNKILIMKKGKMIFSGESEQLIEQAKGKLWMCYLNNDEKALQIEEKYKITSKQFVEGGVRYKILCEEKPFEDAKIAEVSLEDGYIYVNMKK